MDPMDTGCNVRSWTESPDKTKIEEWLMESALPISTLPQSQLNPGLLIDLYLLDSLGKKLESHISFEYLLSANCKSKPK